MGEAAAPYNYAHFDGHVAGGTDLTDEAAFWASPRAGERAPDFTLWRLGDGAEVSLSGLWRSKPLVMEFGSFT
jgi:prepilin-type processing-associated H-X9-DG protein